MKYLVVTCVDDDFIPALRSAVERLWDILIHERREHYDGVSEHVPLSIIMARLDASGLLIPWIDILCRSEQMIGIVELAQRGCYGERWLSRLYYPNKEIFGIDYLKYSVSFDDTAYGNDECATLVQLNLETGECLGYSG